AAGKGAPKKEKKVGEKNGRPRGPRKERGKPAGGGNVWRPRALLLTDLDALKEGEKGVFACSPLEEEEEAACGPAACACAGGGARASAAPGIRRAACQGFLQIDAGLTARLELLRGFDQNRRVFFDLGDSGFVSALVGSENRALVVPVPAGDQARAGNLKRSLH